MTQKRPTLTICAGLPASGKSTWAREQQAIRVNRDDLRAMLHGSAEWSKVREKVTRAARDAAIRTALLAGFDVVSDDTNIEADTRRGLTLIAREVGASVVVREFDVPLDECLRRNATRPNPVPEEVIRRMAARYQPPTPDGPRSYDPTLPDAVLCDLDGTLALLNGRDPYDASTCENDELNEPVMQALARLSAGKHVVFMTGRMQKDAEPTQAWLNANVLPRLIPESTQLRMRATGDTRKDSIVKEELFAEYVDGKFNVLWALDDRKQVVALWRRLGIPTFQVADGDF